MPPFPRSITQVPSTVHRADLFFTENSPNQHLNGAQQQSSTAYHSSRPYSHPRHSFSTPPSPETPSQSPLHRSRTAPPPVPPKPLSRPPPLPSVPEPFRRAERPPILPPPPLPPPPVSSVPDADEQSYIDAALELSKSERQAFLEKLNSQEEEELARALEESLRTTSNPVPGPSLAPSSPPRSSRSLPTEPIVNEPTPSSSPQSSSPQFPGDTGLFASLPARTSFIETPTSRSPSLLDDEALARQIAAEEEAEERGKRDNGSSDSTEDDEAFARRLAAEEDEELKEESRSTSIQEPTNLPPAYDEAVSRPPARPSLPVEPIVPRNNSNSSVSTNGTTTDSPPLMPLSPMRPVSSESPSLQSVHSGSDSLTPLRSLGSDKSLLEKNRWSTISSSSSSNSLPSKPDTPKPLDSPPINANQFVDIELLRGVSMAFAPPVISYHNEPMSTPPQVITLAYGRSPPLHVQGPNWRQLLKLMARLAGTRVEPTVEAMAQVKTDMRLRTVVQFFRPQLSSPEWRTILWFTIDHPISNQPQFRRYLQNDVEVLPFSYSLSACPTLLKDESDTPLSKKYTIPSTESLPYPVLPITFPNLALYLQAALDESRRYMNDSSSGFRKLAKMIDTCYPSLYEDDGQAGTESGRGVGKMFNRFIGRGNRNNKKGRGGNEDTYELVTPFVPEWG
ncbi:hypothetical protein VNI00_001257 [Paramarasmius palmivorus]|uniref:Uncharacterized protein n=1 Tax=Paramarasmius palmivorus TaxID=297713 RepID=A0AAW0E6S7_9AGAR